MIKRLLGTLAGATAILAAMPAAASTQNGTMDVQLIVQPGCALSTGAGGTPTTGGVANAVLSFGTVPSLPTGVIDAQAVSTATGGAVTVTCSSTYVGAGPTLQIGAGLNAAGTQRSMIGPGSVLVNYTLYQDAGRNVPFDPATPVTLVIPASGVSTAVNIYGRVPDASQATADGTYTDTVALTLTY